MRLWLCCWALLTALAFLLPLMTPSSSPSSSSLAQRSIRQARVYANIAPYRSPRRERGTTAPLRDIGNVPPVGNAGSAAHTESTTTSNARESRREPRAFATGTSAYASAHLCRCWNTSRDPASRAATDQIRSGAAGPTRANKRLLLLPRKQFLKHLRHLLRPHLALLHNRPLTLLRTDVNSHNERAENESNVPARSRLSPRRQRRAHKQLLPLARNVLRRRAYRLPNVRRVRARPPDRAQRAVSPPAVPQAPACHRRGGPLPAARRPYTEPAGCHDLGHMDVKCSHCGALHWKDERVAKSSLANPQFGMCCNHGKVDLPPLNALPADLENLFANDSAQAKEFRKNIAQY
ncbi:hypothetical protein B0H16DRAFT_1739011 [Mycena metata]|uniref:Uncharacterized protein n=1 Tax=Mycena metata TaxID=1033252 RepID=A0AAD7HH83_9AGAR|nr:hypothetical protein B0H16DRAFT_1739011 [Mycena metata]